MRKQNGITVIALVITIIVLLILAAVSISAVLGENGIIAKARDAAKKTKKAQEEEKLMLDQSEISMNLSDIGAALKYDVVQKESYAILRLYTFVDGSSTYGDYSRDIVYGKTEEQKIEMLLNGINQKDGTSYENIDELISDWSVNNEVVEGCTTLSEIIEAYECDNLTELLIKLKVVEPDGYTSSKEITKTFIIKIGNAVIKADGTTEFPYVEIPITASGTYTIVMETGDGGRATLNAKVDIDSNESVFVHENEIIIGLDDNYLYDDGGCLTYSKFNLIAIPSIINGQKITTISNATFAGIKGINAIILPNTVTTIEENAFGSCSDLQDINFPNSLVTIGNYAFRNCRNLQEVKFSEGLISIGEAAFDNCTSVTKLDLPSSLTEIGVNAFGDLAITSIEIPSGVTTVRGFGNCSSLEKVTFLGNVQVIGSSAFANCTSLNNVVLPNTVTVIETSAFGSCTSLSNITLSNSLQEIGSSAFASCTKLANITLPNTLTTIGSSAFNNCDALTTIVIPSSVTTLGSSAFASSDALTTVTFNGNIDTLGSYTFSYCKALTTFTINGTIGSIGDYAFQYCEKLSELTLPEGLTTIGKKSFDNCLGLSSIYLPDSLVSIGEDAFHYCRSLPSIYIPAGVTTISQCAIYTYPYSGTFRAYCGAASKPSGWAHYWIPDMSVNDGNLDEYYVSWGQTR